MPHRTRCLMLECHEQTIWESKGRDHCGATADDLLLLNPAPCCDCSYADADRIRDRGQHAFASNGRCPNPWQAVLVADMLPFINLYPHKPLIYNVAWKTTIYFLVAALVHYLERLVDFWKEAGSLAAGNQKLLAEIVWPHFWAIQILLLVLILFYCTMRELVRVIGRDKVLEIFFGTPASARV